MAAKNMRRPHSNGDAERIAPGALEFDEPE